MAAITPLRVPKVVVSLTLFWGFILSVFFRDYGFNFRFLVALAPAVLLGIWLAEIDSETIKNSVLDLLRYNREKNLPVDDFQAFKNEDRGLFSHLGPLPFHASNLAQLDQIDQEILLAHCPKELGDGLKFIEDFVELYKITHPAHVNLLTALLRVFSHPEHSWLPAGIDRHKGRSLFQHSLLVCAVGINESKSFEPQPASARRLAPVDPKYQPNKTDPLIGILCLAHDLGKISSFKVQDGQVVSIMPNHDTMGARLITLIPEYWDPRISTEDRRIIQAVMAFYHHPSEIPVQKNSDNTGFPRVISDRQHYLLDLLIHADLMAGGIENGKSYQDAQVDSEDLASLTAAGNTAPLFAKFLDFMSRVGIGARHTKSVAFKYCDEEATHGRTYLYFDQKEFLTQIIPFIGSKSWSLDSINTKNHEITKIILKELDNEGFLARLGDDFGSSRAADTCLYKVEFWDPKKKESPTITLSNCFVMDVTDCKDLAFLVKHENNHSIPKVVSNSMGVIGQKGSRHNYSALDSAAEEELCGTEAKPLGFDFMNSMLDKPQRTQNKSTQKKINRTKKRISDLLNSPQVDLANPIEVLDTLENGLVLAGLEEIMKENIIEFGPTKEPSDILKEIGILEISPRKSKPGTFIFLVDKNLKIKP